MQFSGGYSEFERRLIGRLTNRADPSRPDLSAQTGVLAVVFYTSVLSAPDFPEVVDKLHKLASFFNIPKKPSILPVPVGVEVSYGLDGAGIHTFFNSEELYTQSQPPDTANLRWSIAGPPNQTLTTVVLPPPGGFLIEVSTLQEGLRLAWEIPTPDTSTEGNGSKGRQIGEVRDPLTNKPLVLFGGSEGLVLDPPNISEASIIGPGQFKPGGVRVYAYRNSTDTIAIPLEKLKTADGKHLLQKTFFVPTRLEIFNPGQGFSIQLRQQDMPWDAKITSESDGTITLEAAGTEPVRNVYCRITALSKEAAAQYQKSARTPYAKTVEGSGLRWKLKDAEIRVQAELKDPVRATQVDSAGAPMSESHRGDPSQVFSLTYPEQDTSQFLETVTAALAVVMLTRSDMPANPDLSPITSGIAKTPTGLESVGKSLIPLLYKTTPSKFYRQNLSIIDARGHILDICAHVARELYDRIGVQPRLLKLAVDKGELLRTFLWSEALLTPAARKPAGSSDESRRFPYLTILESLGDRSNSKGIILNPVCYDVSQLAAATNLQDLELKRSPGFHSREEEALDGTAPFLYNQGDNAPIIFDFFEGNRSAPKMDYVRNVLLGDPAKNLPGKPEVLEAAVAVLNVAAGAFAVPNPQTGAWLSMQFIPQGLTPMDKILDHAVQFLKTTQAGISASTDSLKSYIEFLETRILELQALLNRIDGALSRLEDLKLAPMSALVVVTNGTDGVAAEVISAENKPFDSLTSYGGGFIVLAPGLPTALTNLLKSLIVKE